MRRRDLLAGLGGAAVVGAGGYVALSSGGQSVAPVTVDRFETPAGEGGEMTVPVAGETTVLDLFATTCPPCKPALDALAEARSDATDAQFVSVTAEFVGGSGRTRADVVEWWKTHGGDWPVGHDAESALLGRLDASAIPFTAVIDPGGTVVWSHTGVPDAGDITQAIDDARV